MVKQYRVETVMGGVFTGTVKAQSLQDVINKMSADGWNFKNCQDVIGRRCGCLPYQMIWAIFEKD